MKLSSQKRDEVSKNGGRATRSLRGLIHKRQELDKDNIIAERSKSKSRPVFPHTISRDATDDNKARLLAGFMSKNRAGKSGPARVNKAFQQAFNDNTPASTASEETRTNPVPSEGKLRSNETLEQWHITEQQKEASLLNGPHAALFNQPPLEASPSLVEGLRTHEDFEGATVDQIRHFIENGGKQMKPTETFQHNQLVLMKLEQANERRSGFPLW